MLDRLDLAAEAVDPRLVLGQLTEAKDGLVLGRGDDVIILGPAGGRRAPGSGNSRFWLIGSYLWSWQRAQATVRPRTTAVVVSVTSSSIQLLIQAGDHVIVLERPVPVEARWR